MNDKSSQASTTDPNLVAIATGIAGAIGVLGWITFVGGAILWNGFGRAHLPAADAVSRVPQSVLLATGAEFVLWAFLPALAAVGLIIGFRSLTSSTNVSRRWVALYVFVYWLVTMAGAVLVDAGWETLPFGVLWLLVAAAAALVAWIAITFYLADRRAAFVVSSVIGVPLVIAATTAFQIHNEPRVEPIAVLTANTRPLTGFLIADTDQSLIIGTFNETVSTERQQAVERQKPNALSPSGLRTIPRDEVLGLVVGPRVPLNAVDALPPDEDGFPRTAREWAGRAALRLCHSVQAAPAEPPADQSTSRAERLPTCTKRETERLHRFVANETAAIRNAE